WTSDSGNANREIYLSNTTVCTYSTDYNCQFIVDGLTGTGYNFTSELEVFGEIVVTVYCSIDLNSPGFANCGLSTNSDGKNFAQALTGTWTLVVLMASIVSSVKFSSSSEEA
ncbi:uncharacterized protein LOC142355309, partial [Convolutriloba macropyga]|uniref:uncharacterized protein LOC142355309 n=1 Tax=Convolutriloba macropyga TaxID=536237 RepID=UPI003F51C4DA